MTPPPEQWHFAGAQAAARLRGAAPFLGREPGPLGLRVADETDLPFLQALYASTRADEMATTGWPAAHCEAFLAQQFKAQHDYYHEHYEDAHFLVITQGDTPIGRLYWYERSAEHINLMDIALLPHWRGQGLGSALLRSLAAWADTHGQLIELHVEPCNPARQLYRRLGFVVRGDNGVYLRMHRSPQPAGARITLREAANA